MPPHVHVLLSKDETIMTGVCRNCGTVDLLIKGVPRCGNAVRAQRVSPNRRTGDKDRNRWGSRKEPHGLTTLEARALREGKVCEICGSPEDLNVDHCHQTRRRRGILCNKHNRALGLFADSVEHLQAAIAYLQKGTPAGG